MRFETLTSTVAGPVMVPGNPGYDDERLGFQTAWSHRPDVIVGATSARDVQAAVAFAAEHDLRMAVQATGHGLGTPLEQGLLISTRRMNGMHVDPTTATARLGAGVTAWQVVDAAAPHGLAPLSGSAPDVGAIGYTLGGGLPILGRRHGWAADHVRSIDLVGADAQQRRVSAESDPDLFWALRGGRPAVGIVTGMEIELMPVPRLYGGGLYFDAELATEVLHAWQAWTATVPEEMCSSVALIPFPDVPALPEPLRGRHVAHVRIAHTGTAESGERLVAPLRAVGPRLIDALGDMPYHHSATIYNEPTTPMGYTGVNAMLDRIEPRALDELLILVGPGAEIPHILEIRHLGGALTRPPAAPNAVGHRDGRYLIDVLARIDDTELEAARAVQHRVERALSPWTLGRCRNFLYGANATTERVRAAHDLADHDRLEAIQARWDPTGRFASPSDATAVRV